MGVTPEWEGHGTKILLTIGEHLIPGVFRACVQVWVEWPSLPDPCRGFIGFLLAGAVQAVSGWEMRAPCPSPGALSSTSSGKVIMGTFPACFSLQPGIDLSLLSLFVLTCSITDHSLFWENSPSPFPSDPGSRHRTGRALCPSQKYGHQPSSCVLSLR